MTEEPPWNGHILSDMSIMCKFMHFRSEKKKHFLHYMQGRGNLLYEISIQLNHSFSFIRL